jgi:hypothetical protein
MKAIQVLGQALGIAAQATLVLSVLLLVANFLLRDETTGKAFIWTFAAYAVMLGIALVLLIFVRLYGWLSGRTDLAPVSEMREVSPARRWWLQWVYATSFAAVAGAIWHVWWRPIPWWTDGNTLTPTSGALVTGIGLAWVAVVYAWKRWL